MDQLSNLCKSAPGTVLFDILETLGKYTAFDAKVLFFLDIIRFDLILPELRPS